MSLLRILRAPRWRTMGLIVALWLALAIVNYLLQRRGFVLGTSKYFPLMVVGFAPHLRGLPWALLFVLLLAARLRYRPRFTTWSDLALAALLVLVGNLVQGSLPDVFIAPFTQGHIQYYHDALTIRDGRAFLAGFNELQAGLQDHGRTHPPFAVLIHYWLLGSQHGRLWLLATVFSFISLLSLPLFWLCARKVSEDSRVAGDMALLLAVTPAFNIYAIVCLDGVIATFGTLFLLALIELDQPAPAPWWALPALVAAGVAVNLLTFGGLFFLALLGVVATHELIVDRRIRLAIAGIVLCGVLALVCFVMAHDYGYDHLKSLALASRLENPDGFRGFTSPGAYVMTRLGDVWELALFGSIPLIALLIRRKRAQPSTKRGTERVAVAAGGVLLAMFVAGAFKKGETARACLFAYPFLMLPAADSPSTALAGTIGVAGLQTIVMQLAANFYW